MLKDGPVQTTAPQKQSPASTVSSSEAHQPNASNPYAGLLKLQRAIGNRAMGQLIHSEVKPPSILISQHKGSCGKLAGVVSECSECQHKPLSIQRKATNDIELSKVPLIVHEVLKSPGQPLELETRNFMESRFKHDFSRVRVHTDAQAALSAQIVNASAYTVENEVVLSEGQYAPKTNKGQSLLAHELAHVIQQSRPNASSSWSQDESLERSARQASFDVTNGAESVHVVGASQPKLARQEHDEELRPVLGGARLAAMGISIVESDRVTHWGSESERQQTIREYIQYAREHGLQTLYNEAVTAYPDIAAGSGLLDQGMLSFDSDTLSQVRQVRAIRFVALPTLVNDVVELEETTVTQTEADPTAGYNFDTYLINETTGQRILAQHLGGTRYRVLMGSTECPGCHLGQGLIVDLHGEHFALVMLSMLPEGASAFGGRSLPLRRSGRFPARTRVASTQVETPRPPTQTTSPTPISTTTPAASLRQPIRGHHAGARPNWRRIERRGRLRSVSTEPSVEAQGTETRARGRSEAGRQTEPSSEPAQAQHTTVEEQFELGRTGTDDVGGSHSSVSSTGAERPRAMGEHTRGARPSTRGTHEHGQARDQRQRASAAERQASARRAGAHHPLDRLRTEIRSKVRNLPDSVRRVLRDTSIPDERRIDILRQELGQRRFNLDEELRAILPRGRQTEQSLAEAAQEIFDSLLESGAFN